MRNSASYVSRIYDVSDDATSSKSLNGYISINISARASIKAQNIGNAHGYVAGIFNFPYHFR